MELGNLNRGLLFNHPNEDRELVHFKDRFRKEVPRLSLVEKAMRLVFVNMQSDRPPLFPQAT